MRRLLSLLPVLFLALGLVGCASDPKEAAVEKYRSDLESVQHLQSVGVFDSSTVTSATAQIQTKASETLGRPIPLSELKSWKARVNFMIGLQFVMILAGLCAFVGLCWLIKDLFLAIPGILWEVLVWSACIWLMFWPPFPWLTFLGCLGVIGGLELTTSVHKFNIKNQGTAISAVCFIAWTIVALVHGDMIIAGAAVLALESLLGFQVYAGSLCVAMGFNDRDITLRATMASFFLMAFGMICAAGWFTGPLQTGAALFAQPLLFIGTFVYFLGMLILSCTGSPKEMKYWIVQLMTIVSGAFAIGLARMPDVPFVHGIGGTFFGLYLAFKYGEFTFYRNRARALGFLGLAALLYLLVWAGKTYPQFFIPNF